MHIAFQLSSPSKVVSEARSRSDRLLWLAPVNMMHIPFQLSSPDKVVSEAVADLTDYFAWHL